MAARHRDGVTVSFDVNHRTPRGIVTTSQTLAFGEQYSDGERTLVHAKYHDGEVVSTHELAEYIVDEDDTSRVESIVTLDGDSHKVGDEIVVFFYDMFLQLAVRKSFWEDGGDWYYTTEQTEGWGEYAVVGRELLAGEPTVERRVGQI